MATLDQVIDSCLTDYLLTGQREPRNVLQTTVDADDTTVALTYSVKGAQEGSRLAVDFEDCYVVASDPTAKTATVIRGQFGTSGAAHTAGATIWVNPKFSRAQILRAVNDELRSLSAAGLYQMATLDLTFLPTVMGYDFTGVTPDDVLDVYEVLADYPGPTTAWVPLTHYRVIRDAPSGDFPSGMGIVLNEGGHPGFTVRVTYKTRFTAMTSSQGASEVATVSGLDSEAHDLLAIGAAIRLVSGAEVRRSQLNAQPDTRRAEEVPPGATLQSVRGLMALREQRLAEEKARLARRYPVRLQRVAMGV